MKEVEARELLPVIIDFGSAISRLRTASALLAADRKAEVAPVLIQVGEDLEGALAVLRRLLEVSDGDAV